jgi:hypothetical protein
VLGKVNFLEKSSRPEIAYAVHQCARFSNNPKQSHANALKYLWRYLMATKDKGLILRPDVSKSFEVHVDCDFAGNWVKEDAMTDPSTPPSPAQTTSSAMVAARSFGRPNFKLK